MEAKALKAGMRNDKGEVVDRYLPRRCDWTNRLITAKDHKSVQISICELSQEGHKIQGEKRTYDICGYVRNMGRSDGAINALAHRDKLLPRMC